MIYPSENSDVSVMSNMDKLPDELLEQIFDMVMNWPKQEQKIREHPSQNLLSLVSKRWRNLIARSTQFRLNLYEQNQSQKMLETFMNSKRIQYLLTISPSFDTENVLTALNVEGFKCKEMRMVLRPVDKHGVRKSQCLEVKESQVKKLFEFTKKLEKILIEIDQLNFTGNAWTDPIKFENLQDLEINLTTPHDLKESMKILNLMYCRKLTVFKFYVAEYSDYNSEEFEFIFEFLRRNLTSIKKVDVKIGPMRSFYWDGTTLKIIDFLKHITNFQTTFQQNLENLENLTILYCGDLEQIKHLLRPTLKSFEADVKIHDFQDEPLNNLQKLELYHCQVNEDIIGKLSRRFPNLKELKFKKSGKILPNVEAVMTSYFPNLDKYSISLH